MIITPALKGVHACHVFFSAPSFSAACTHARTHARPTQGTGRQSYTFLHHCVSSNSTVGALKQVRQAEECPPLRSMPGPDSRDPGLCHLTLPRGFADVIRKGSRNGTVRIIQAAALLPQGLFKEQRRRDDRRGRPEGALNGHTAGSDDGERGQEPGTQAASRRGRTSLGTP